MNATVRRLSYTPVKGTRLCSAPRLTLGRDGCAEDRAFYLVDERGRMMNAKTVGELCAVVSSFDGDGTLSLRFPDGTVVTESVRDGDAVATRFYSGARTEVLVEGPWSAALSAFLGRSVRLVRAIGPGRGVDRGARGGVSLISQASLARLAAETPVDEVDPRRFRMTIEFDGVPAHVEDAWVGARVRVGEALVQVHGHVGRCLITSRDPESGVIDLPTLDVLAGYRGNVETTEPLPLGIYGEVLEGGDVALGDPVVLEAGPSR